VKKRYEINLYNNIIQYTCKFEKNKQTFLSENCEDAFSNKKHKQSKAHEKHK